MNDGIEAFRLQLQKELGLSIGPKDPLLAQWVSQKQLLEQNAAEHQRLLGEFEAALGRNQTAWSEQAKSLAQQSLNAALRASLDSTALMLPVFQQVFWPEERNQLLHTLGQSCPDQRQDHWGPGA